MRNPIILVLFLCGFLPVFRASIWSGKCDDKLPCLCPEASTDTIDCSAKEIAVLPNDMSFPTQVETASFRENNIEAISTSHFTYGRGLHTLDLSFNKIRFIASNAFQHLEKTVKLDLSHNDIWNLPFDVFVGLTDLRSVDFSYNKITTFFHDVFKPCSNLRELTFRYNPMLFLERGSFQYLPALEKLNLESTGLGSLPFEVFKNNSLLNELILTANTFKTIPLKGLLSARSLKILDVSENPIETLEDGSFKGLESLQILTISHMRLLRSVESGAFHGTPSLLELFMSDNIQLTKISESAFVVAWQLDKGQLFQEQSLISVDLRHCGLTNLPKYLLRWEEIGELDLSENPWNCDCHLAWIADADLDPHSKKSMVCSKPPHLGGKTVAGLAASDFTCRLLSADAIIGLSLLVSLSFMIALGTVAYFLYRRRFCFCLIRARGHRYMRVISSKEKVDLEWDHGAEPNSESSRA